MTQVFASILITVTGYLAVMGVVVTLDRDLGKIVAAFKGENIQ